MQYFVPVPRSLPLALFDAGLMEPAQMWVLTIALTYSRDNLFPAMSELRRHIPWSDETIRRALRRSTELGLLEKTGATDRGTPVYKVTDRLRSMLSQEVA